MLPFAASAVNSNHAYLVVDGICPHDCPDACGMQTRVSDGRAIEILGQQDHPVTAGWLCAKVAPYLERVYHPDRLLTPLKRIGPRGMGNWQAISWAQAIDEIASRWRDIIARHGAEAILPYSYSGTLGLVQMTVASARLWNRLGASQLERSICMAATRHAVRATVGARMSPPYHHVLDSKLLVLWGHNPVSTAPHLLPFVRRAQQRGCKLVVIDPLRSRSCRGADLHLQPLPGTDAALALGVAQQLIESGRHDADWLARHALGFEAFRERAAHYDLERVARITGIEPAAIRRFARLYSDHEPAMIRLGDAVNRNRQGGQTVRAIAALPALTAQYGVRGGGLGCSTGDYFQWDEEAINHWQKCPPAGRMVNMNRIGAALLGEVSAPPIQSLFVFGANPMVSSPNTAKVLRGLQREDLFTVVHDLFMTDTARQADIVLPATSQLEQVDLHRGYGHTLLGYNHPAIAPLGESKSNWEVMQLLARALGFTESWLYESADEVIDGVLRATRHHNPRLAQVSARELRAKPWIEFATRDEVPFADGCFATPSGKVELESAQYAALGLSALPEWRDDRDDEITTGADPDGTSLLLVSPAAHHFVNSSMANQASLKAREKAPQVLLNLLDARARGIGDGDPVRLHNARGYCLRQARISTAVRTGVAVAVNGYWADGERPVTINWTTSDELADVAGQSSFQSNRVWITGLHTKPAEMNHE
jgi:anaerobic selenocysteine-containing dehydrogenase